MEGVDLGKLWVRNPNKKEKLFISRQYTSALIKRNLTKIRKLRPKWRDGWLLLRPEQILSEKNINFKGLLRLLGCLQNIREVSSESGKNIKSSWKVLMVGFASVSISGARWYFCFFLFFSGVVIGLNKVLHLTFVF